MIMNNYLRETTLCYKCSVAYVVFGLSLQSVEIRS